MNKAMKKYKTKIKSRKVEFYLCDEEIYLLSKSINFNKFVKEKLEELLKGKGIID